MNVSVEGNWKGINERYLSQADKKCQARGGRLLSLWVSTVCFSCEILICHNVLPCGSTAKYYSGMEPALTTDKRDRFRHYLKSALLGSIQYDEDSTTRFYLD